MRKLISCNQWCACKRDSLIGDRDEPESQSKLLKYTLYPLKPPRTARSADIRVYLSNSLPSNVVYCPNSISSYSTRLGTAGDHYYISRQVPQIKYALQDKWFKYFITLKVWYLLNVLVFKSRTLLEVFQKLSRA